MTGPETGETPARARQIRLARAPRERLSPDDFLVHEHVVPELRRGQFLVRNTWLSVDASTMLRIGGNSGDYLAPLQPGAPIEGWAVGRVATTHSPSWNVGDRVLHNHGWRDHTLFDDSDSGWGMPERLPDDGHPDHAYVGALGPTGLTAWAGLVEVAALSEGDVVFVSAAAGAVGSLAVQLAVSRGHRVIASAGSADKLATLRALGVDVALNYKDGPLNEQLKDAAPDGIDVYFDNVGGDHLEAALDSLRVGGRVALCGAVSSYGPGGTASGPSNLFNATAKGLSLRGFLARMYAGQSADSRRELGNLMSIGRLKLPLYVAHGLDQAPQALLDLMAGRNTGKVVVRLQD
ncbi:NADP-dependent oxidoreductase [Nocardioides sp.]|uniref:NADP-dependent oxidoreductase n=1 Tax=Nocardioides sp. TaxID=35761 RepID=UPI00321B2003